MGGEHEERGGSGTVVGRQQSVLLESSGGVAEAMGGCMGGGMIFPGGAKSKHTSLTLSDLSKQTLLSPAPQKQS